MRIRSKRKLNVYLPILFIVLSVMIVAGLTFAIYQKTLTREAYVNFGKIELSIDGYKEEVLLDNVLPGQKLTNQIAFEKATNSGDMYVRAKIEFRSVDDTVSSFVEQLNSEAAMNIYSNNEVDYEWSQRYGMYYYLLQKEDNSLVYELTNNSNIIFTDELYLDLSLTQLPNLEQYMASIQLIIELQAIQSFSVSNTFTNVNALFEDMFKEVVPIPTDSHYFEFNGSTLCGFSEAGQNLTDIIIPETYIQQGMTQPTKITNIEYGAFKDNKKLYSVTMSEGITNIGNDAFSGCYRLTDVKLPTSLTTIGSNAFCDTAIKNIKIPRKVKYIYGNPFSACNDLGVLKVDENNRYFTSRDANDIECNAILSKEGSVLYCATTNTTIPNTVRTIASYAYYLVNAAVVNIPNNVDVIQQDAFSDSYIISLTLPVNLRNIGYQNTYKLVEVKNPSQCYVNDKFNNRSSINLPISFLGLSDRTNISKSNDGKLYTYFYNGERYLMGIVDNGTEVIDQIPGDARYIFDHFSRSSHLKNIYIPYTVTTIGSYAFERNYRLKTIELPDEMTTFNTSFLSYNDEMEELIIPGDTLAMNSNSMSYLANLSILDIRALSAQFQPNSIRNNYVYGQPDTNKCYILVQTSLIRDALVNSGCDAMGIFIREKDENTIASLADNVWTQYNPNNKYIETTLGSDRYAYFRSTKNPTEIYVEPQTSQQYFDIYTSMDVATGEERAIIRNVTPSGAELNSLIIPKYYNDGERDVIITAIESLGNSQATNIVIPTYIDSIGCSTSRVGALNNTAWFNNQPDGLVYKDGWCLGFKGEAPTGELTFAENTIGIGGGAFYNCDGITKVTIPNTVLTIEDYAFRECDSLAEVELASDADLQIIRSYAFAITPLLQEFTFNDNLNSISHYAFWQSGLTEVNIPASVNIIGGVLSDVANPFAECNALTTITVNENNPIFKSESNTIIVKEDNSLLLGCKESTIPSYITKIHADAFYKIVDLTTLDLSDCALLTTISKNAFSYCSGLTNIDFSGCTQLTSINNEAFSYCSGLTTLDFSGCTQLTTIDDSAFMNCDNLKVIILPNSLESVGSNAFNKQSIESDLICVTMPNRNISLENNSFESIKYAVWDTDGMQLSFTSETTNLVEQELGADVKSALDEASWTAVVDTNDIIFTTIYNEETYYKLSHHPGKYYLVTFNPTDLFTYSGNTIVGVSELYLQARPNKIIIPAQYVPQGSTTPVNITRIDGSGSSEGYLFSDDFTIKEVVISEGITEMNKAFIGCINLSSIVLPNSLLYLDNSIEFCGISSIKIPKNINYSASVTYLRGCSKIETLIVDEENPYFTSKVDGVECNAILSKDGTRIIKACRNTTIPSTVTTIAQNAFGYVIMSGLVVPEGVTTIEFNAFVYASINTLTLPSTLTFLDSQPIRALGEVKNLSTTFTNENIISLLQNEHNIGLNVFSEGDFTTEHGDKYVTYINGDVKYLMGLVDIETTIIDDIPADIDAIYPGAFAYNYYIEKLTIPNTVTSVGRNYIENNFFLNELILPDSISAYPTVCYGAMGVEEIVLPSETLTITRANSLAWNYNLSILKINATTATIAPDAIAVNYFDGKPETNKLYVLVENTIVRDAVANSGCEFLGIYTRETDTEILASLADNEWSLLNPDNEYLETTISSEGLSYFRSISAPDDIYNVPPTSTIYFNISVSTDSENQEYAIINSFTADGLLLEEIVIPETYFDGVKEIPITTINSFGECQATKIIIPSTITDIRYANVYDSSTGTTSRVNAFQNTDWYIAQPSGLVYLSGWLIGCKGSAPSGELTIQDGTKGIASYALYQANKEFSVNIPDSLLYINEGAFESSGLTELNLSASVNMIGGPNEINPFKDCKRLTIITLDGENAKYKVEGNTIIKKSDNSVYVGCVGSTIPADVTKINSYAFYGCDGLITIDLSSCTALTKLEYNAFYGCTNLVAVVLPNIIQTIGDEMMGGAFYKASNHKPLVCVAMPNHTITNYYDFSNIKYAVWDTSGVQFSLGSQTINLVEQTLETTVQTALEDATWTLVDATEGIVYKTIYDNQDYYKLSHQVDKYYLATYNAADLFIYSGQTIMGTSSLYDFIKPSKVIIPSQYTPQGETTPVNITTIDGSYMGSGLLYNDANIKEVVVSEGITEIYYAFQSCINLTSIKLPNSLSTISSSVSKCGITTINIPNNINVGGIGYNFLRDVTKLKTLTVDENNPYLTSKVDGVECNAILSKDGTTLIRACNSTTIPATVTTIDSYAFGGTIISDLVVPEGVTIISESAFSNAIINTLTLPSTLTTFSYQSIKALGEVKNLSTSISNETLLTQLQSTANIGLNVFSEGDFTTERGEKYVTYTYNNVKYLMGLVDIETAIIDDIPADIGAIYPWAFAYNYYIEKINIPNTVTSVGTYYIENNFFLNELVLPDSISTYPTVSRGTYMIDEIVLPGETLILSGANTITNNFNLSVLKINATIATIATNAIKYNYNNSASSTNKLYVLVENSAVRDAVVNSSCDALGVFVRENDEATITSLAENEWSLLNSANQYIETTTSEDGSRYYRSVSNRSEIFTDSYTSQSYFTFSFYTEYDYSSDPYYGEEIQRCQISGLTTAGESLTTLNIPKYYYDENNNKFPIYQIGSLGNSLATNITIPGSVRCPMSAVSSTRWYSYQSSNSVVYMGNVCIGYKGTVPRAVVIREGTTAISNSAFSNTNITSVSIPNTVRYIGDNAFSDCGSLTSLTIPNSVETIGEKAFYYYSNALKTLIIGSGVTSLGKDFIYVYNVKDMNISINANNPKYKLLDKALYSKDKKELIWASSVTTSIANDTKVIKENAFNQCNISNLVIPDSVEVIEDKALGYSNTLKSIYIGKGLREISGNALASLYYLERIEIDSENPYLKTDEDMTYIVSQDGEKLFLVTKNCTEIKDNIKEIGNYAFVGAMDRMDYENSKSIIIPGTIEIIGEYICGTAWDMEMSYGGSVEIIAPDLSNLRIIKDNALSYCRGSFNIDLTNATFVGEGAFKYCYGLKSVILPESMTEISNSAFSSCSGLTSITIPDGVTSIGNSAFSYCSSLTSIDIPDSVTSIGQRAFYYSSGITSINIPDGVTSISDYAFNNCSKLLIVNIEEGVESIGNYAFQQCGSLMSMTIPSTVNSIGTNAFSGCNSLVRIKNYSGLNLSQYGLPAVANQQILTTQGADFETDITITEENGFKILNKIDGTKQVLGVADGAESVTITSGMTFKASTSGVLKSTSLKTVIIAEGVTSILDYMFANCTSLSSITIPESVTSIGIYAFQNCTSLTEIDLPDTLTTLGSYAFWSCTGLTSISIPNGITGLGGVFSGCTGLTSVTIPFGVTNINNAFYGCTGLTSVTIPNGVTNIYNAFYGCTGLTEIVLPDTLTGIGQSAFVGCTGLTEIVLPNTITNIGYYAFQNCTGLTSITIPNSVTSISDYAFYNCTSLKYVNLANITQVPNYAFYNCSSLTSINNPNLQRINEYAFYGCSELISVNLYNATSVGAYAFHGCSKLASVNLYNATSVGTYAFYGCSKLASMNLYNTKTIGQYAFYGCSALTLTNMPNNCTSVGNSAFENCSSITSFKFGSSATSIGMKAFKGCKKLVSVTFGNTSGWVVNKTNANTGDSVSLTDAATNASYLRGLYTNYYWRHS